MQWLFALPAGQTVRVHGYMRSGAEARRKTSSPTTALMPKATLMRDFMGVKTLAGDLGLWFDYAFSKAGTLVNGQNAPSSAGWAIGVGHTRRNG